MWFDGGLALGDNAKLPWADMTEIPQPSTHGTAWFSSGRDHSTRNFNLFGNTDCARLTQPYEYSKGLDRTVAAQDPFYALTHLFGFVVRAEHHFLNMMHSMSNTSPAEYDMNNSPLVLNNLVYNKTILERHVRQIKECMSLIDSRGGPDWRRATEVVHKEALAAMKTLSADFRVLLDSSQSLVNLLHQQIELIHSQAGLRESRGALEQAKSIKVLTAITVLFLPLSFVTSFFGMRLEDFGSEAGLLWHWVAVSMPVLVTSLTYIWFISGGFRSIQKFGSSLMGKRKRSTSDDDAAGPAGSSPHLKFHRQDPMYREKPKPGELPLDFPTDFTQDPTPSQLETGAELPDKPASGFRSFASSSVSDLEKNARIGA